MSLTTRSAYLTYYPGSINGNSRACFNDVVAGDSFVVTTGQTYMNDLPATSSAFDNSYNGDTSGAFIGLIDAGADCIVGQRAGVPARSHPRSGRKRCRHSAGHREPVNAITANRQRAPHVAPAFLFIPGRVAARVSLR